MDCEPCAHNNAYGHHGLRNQTHCRDCHQTFPASNLWGHCSRCHHTFAGASTFDRHHMRGLCDILVSSYTPGETFAPAEHSARMEPGGGKRYLELVDAGWGWIWQWDGSRL